MAVVCLSVLVIVLDNSIMNVALPGEAAQSILGVTPSLVGSGCQ